MPLHAPQMVLNSRMLYFTWVPADPDAVAKLMPPGLDSGRRTAQCLHEPVRRRLRAIRPPASRRTRSPTSAPDLAGHDTPDGAVSGRWWTHYFNSSAEMRAYASERGVPASPGTTTLEHDGDRLVGHDRRRRHPVIRTTVHVGPPSAEVARGQLRYLTDVDGIL